ncbi:unnamed protein product [Penicillium bialowiezense]
MADASGNALKRPHLDDQDNSQKRTRSNNGSPAPGQGGPAPGKSDIARMIAEASSKADAVRARLQAARGGATATPTPPATEPASPAPPAPSPAMSKLEQMKARVAAATQRASAPSQPRPAAPAQSYQPPTRDDEGMSRARGGLDVGLHPALLSDAASDFRKGKQAKPKRAGGPQLDLSGPSVEEIKNNPYFDPSLNPKATIAKPRQTRQLLFNEKGKYIQQAAALRRQAQLEAMKKRIAEKARQAGLDEEMDVEKSFLVPAPPAVEWWDEGLINGGDYAAIDNPQNIKIDTPDTIITAYVQHPIQLEPPQEKHVPAQKPMHLTPKEQAKIRRQRRAADLKEEQAKIRLGLVEAPAPKVKKSNLMRVLGEQAVKDPTAVEARVTREIADRKQTHEQANAERKLTKEERHEKLAAQQEKDASLGICVMHPKLNLVVVEGGKHSINNYRKLMVNRIDWTENPGSDRAAADSPEAQVAWLSTQDEKGEPRDFSQNTCNLIWEGQAKGRSFKRWFGARVCETDSAAKDALSRAKMENFWTLAKSAKPAEF